MLNIYDHVVVIENELSEHFNPLPPGTYLKGQLLPVFKPNTHYYTESGLLKNTPIVALEDHKEAILNVRGEIAIPRYAMQNKAKFLSSEPTMPLQAALLMEAFAKYYLESICPYATHNHYAKNLYNLIARESHHMVDDGFIDRAMESLADDIRQFVGKDIWHIYFVKLGTDTVHIEKTIDYRVYKYYELMDKQNESKSERGDSA